MGLFKEKDLSIYSTSHDALFKPPQKYISLMSCASSYTSVTFNCLLNRIQTPQHGTQDHASLGNAPLTWNSSAESMLSTVGMTITDKNRQRAREMLSVQSATLEALGTESEPQNPCKKSQGWWHTFTVTVLGGQRQDTLWGSLASQLPLLANSKPVRDPISTITTKELLVAKK